MDNFEKIFDLNESCFDEPIAIDDYESEKFLAYLKTLLLIRFTENILAEKRKLGKIGGPVHLAAGQEAIALGISTALTNKDFVFSAHRSHAHLLALDPNPYGLFAEVLGKSTGLSRGFGGSMHLWNGDSGFKGSVPIVSGTVPLAVGAALSVKIKNIDSIAVAYFGDGAMEEGVIHESMNLASRLELPILFVCENNYFSSHLHINERQPSKFNARFAIAHQIEAKVVDGNNLKSVIDNANQLIKHIRNSRRPAFLETFTYRLYGHVDWREDIDVGVGRSTSDLNLWKSRDPIKRLINALSKYESFSERLQIIEGEVRSKIIRDWEKAESDSLPNNSELLTHVYFSNSREQNV
jgi:pyruvate dehydrogenase E1 component alpha subunit